MSNTQVPTDDDDAVTLSVTVTLTRGGRGSETTVVGSDGYEYELEGPVDWSDLLKRHDHRTHELEIYRIGYETESQEVEDKVKFANDIFDSFVEQLTEYCSINEPTDEYDKERLHIVSLFGMCTNLPFHELPEDPRLLNTAGVTAELKPFVDKVLYHVRKYPLTNNLINATLTESERQSMYETWTRWDTLAQEGQEWLRDGDWPTARTQGPAPYGDGETTGGQ